MEKIRVLIVDDHAILRAGLQLLINTQADLEVVGQVASVRDLLARAPQLAPDVICLDLSMPDGSGLTAVAPVRAACPGVKILVLTVHTDTAYVHAALAAGAHGYVAKTAAPTELLSAIRAVHQNRLFVDLELHADVASGPRASSSPRPAGGQDSLSPREREVLEMLAHGYTNQQAADRLFLSVKTVETYRSRIAEKLGLRDRADLVRYAVEMGLLAAMPGASASVRTPSAEERHSTDENTCPPQTDRPLIDR